jgi:glyoxylase-like metal-dependent hydrolase (beta-lactamase superfamily II)
VPRIAAALLCSAALVSLSSAFVATQNVVRTADPAKRGLKTADFPRTIKVAENVYTYEDFHAGDEKFTTTNMFVVGDAGVLVADGQGSPVETRGLVDAIAKVTPKPIRYVVIASDHGDHTAGNVSFPAGVTYIVHPTSKAILDRSAEASRSTGNGSSRATPPWTVPANAVLVSDKQSFKLGDQSFDVIFFGRAHTGGDLGVWLPRQRILFLSEIFLNRVFPAMRSAYPSEWLKTMDRVQAINADIYIAGHGFTETGPVSREEIAAYHRALQAVINEAKRLHDAGVPVEDAIKQANFGEYASWTLSASQGPIAIRKVYDELDGKLK